MLYEVATPSGTTLLCGRAETRTFVLSVSQRGQSKRVWGRAGLRCGNPRKGEPSEPGEPHGPFVGDDMRKTLQERFAALWVPEPNTGCHLWIGTLNHSGYGDFYAPHGKSRRTLAHRVAWALANGPVPNGLVIDHICRVRSCVNPDHLRLVTVAQNTLENSLSFSALNKKKTHCPAGHEYTPENTRAWPHRPGSRYCRVCQSLAKPRHRADYKRPSRRKST